MAELDIYNGLIDTNKAFGVIPAAYETLVALGTLIHFKRVLFLNTTDVDVDVKFPITRVGFTGVLTVLAGSSISLDNFSHNGTIQYKYSSAIPSSGVFKMVSWPGAS